MGSGVSGVSQSDYKFSYKFPARALTSLTVYNTGVQKCAADYGWGPGVRDHYLLHYVIAGKGRYQAFGHTWEVGAGEVFAVYPDVNIFYQSDSREPWEYCWVGFNGTDAALLLEQTDLSRESPVCAVDGDGVYKQMMQITRAQGSLSYQAATRTGALYLLFALLIRDRRHMPRRSAASAYVSDACDFVARHYQLPIGIQDIADHVGLSRSRLYRVFREEMQLSPADYLAHFRIRQACALLERDGLSVKAVALSVGYADQLYFSRRFRGIMGESPTEYRLRAKKATP